MTSPDLCQNTDPGIYPATEILKSHGLKWYGHIQLAKLKKYCMKESASDSNMMMMTFVKLNVRQGPQVTFPDQNTNPGIYSVA